MEMKNGHFDLSVSPTWEKIRKFTVMKEKSDRALEQVNLTSFVGQKKPGLNPAVVLLTSLVMFNITQTK